MDRCPPTPHGSSRTPQEREKVWEDSQWQWKFHKRPTSEPEPPVSERVVLEFPKEVRVAAHRQGRETLPTREDPVGPPTISFVVTEGTVSVRPRHTRLQVQSPAEESWRWGSWRGTPGSVHRRQWRPRLVLEDSGRYAPTTQEESKEEVPPGGHGWRKVGKLWTHPSCSLRSVDSKSFVFMGDRSGHWRCPSCDV